MTIRDDIGKRVRELRKGRTNYTQVQLSKKIGSSPNFIGNIERGLSAPSTDNLIALADHLNCSVADIFALVQSKHSPSGKTHALHVEILDLMRGFDRRQLLLIIDMLKAARDRLEID